MTVAVPDSAVSWPNDRIDSGGDTTVEVRLLSVAGFRVDRNNTTVTYTIQEDDRCDMPDQNTENEGIVRQLIRGGTGSCTCASDSIMYKAGRADGESDSYARSALKWRTDSTTYCPDSPYQRQ